MSGVRSRPWSAALAALALVCAVVGCGSDAEGGDADADVRDVVAQMQEAFKASDAAAVCEQLTAATREQVGATGGGAKETCEGRFAELFRTGQVSEDADQEVTSVKVDGDRAVVVAKSSATPEPQRATLAREGGDWRVVQWLTATDERDFAAGASDSAASRATAREAIQTRINIAYSQFLEPFEDGRAKGVCASVSQQAKQRLKTAGSSCEEAVAQAYDSGDLRDLEWPMAYLVGLKIDGDSATARLKRDGRPPVSISFVKEGTAWRVDSATGIVDG